MLSGRTAALSRFRSCGSGNERPWGWLRLDCAGINCKSISSESWEGTEVLRAEVRKVVARSDLYVLLVFGLSGGAQTVSIVRPNV
jgi:hypothetical protein